MQSARIKHSRKIHIYGCELEVCAENDTGDCETDHASHSVQDTLKFMARPRQCEGFPCRETIYQD